MEEEMPDSYQQLVKIVEKLEAHYNDMQDVEFTVDNGMLYMLQTRTGKRTGFAAIRMAVEMLEEGLIDERQALMRVDPDQLVQLLAPVFPEATKAAAEQHYVAKGINAGPGAASGRIALSSDKAVQWREEGIRCILVREESNPDDFPGMVAAEGVLTVRGGSTSHAAVVARGIGKPCIVGCGALTIDEDSLCLKASGRCLKEGASISIDGTTGEVFFTALETSPSEVMQVIVEGTKALETSLVTQNYLRIMELADKVRTLEVRCNVDTGPDAAVARAFGAQGVGLCRTEHMFLGGQRLLDVRRMFFSTSGTERAAAIDRLLHHQRKDFVKLFRAMDGLPVTIRLLDPPLHEFMPHTEEEINGLARAMEISHEKLVEIRSQLQEQNPMLGHRGCRLGVVYPDVTAMQTRAIIEAALEAAEGGVTVCPEIMVPLVGMEKELEHQKHIIDDAAMAVFEKQGKAIDYAVGTMIELPRAALLADRIAQHAEFFSFGTNDLTQTTYGISRDDAGKFIPTYLKGVPDPLVPEDRLRLMTHDPFQVLDEEGVGQLMEIAIERGRKTRSNLECGICGEHGGDARSVRYCHKIGLDYVSCSPYRIPIARLAAAQSAVEGDSKDL
ncbi:hypothetical protein SCG7086_DQ_00020 [Chlamydiales bacterium SCGC AG-110-P3]|nr:hypothetical protein SCG7086_DQ_00020 [Chlamydiales bacterium SCGC AG-110-P3]